MIIGTVAYMAPEQARGKVVDRRADIPRQLGCATLWTEDLTNGQLLHGVRVKNPFS